MSPVCSSSIARKFLTPGNRKPGVIASRNIAGAALSPTVGLVETAGQVTGSALAGDWRRSDTRALRRLTPYQNLFYLRRLFDAAEEGVGR